MKTEPAWRASERVADFYDEVLPFFTGTGEVLVAGPDPAPATRMGTRSGLGRSHTDTGRSSTTSADRGEEMRLRMRAIPGPGAVMQRADPLLIGREP